MRARRATEAAVLALFLLGASLTALPGPVRSVLETRHQNVVVQEWDASCGAATLATVLSFGLGDPVTERAVALGILRQTDPDRVRGRGGFSLLDLKRYASGRGYAAEGYAGLTRGQLLALAPVIVPVARHGAGHFVVFRGVVRGQAVLADPAFGNRTLPFAEFENQWSGRVGFVVRHKSKGVKGKLAAREDDLLRVSDEAEQAATEEKTPKPLPDAKLALLAFGPGTAGNLDAIVAAGTLDAAPADSMRRNNPTGTAGAFGGATAVGSRTSSGRPGSTSSATSSGAISTNTTTITASVPSTTTISVTTAPTPSIGVSVGTPSLPVSPPSASAITSTVTSTLSGTQLPPVRLPGR